MIPIQALVYCARGDDVDTVVIDGVTRVRGGELIDIDVDALRASAATFNRKLGESVAQLSYRDKPLPEFYAPAFPAWQPPESE